MKNSVFDLYFKEATERHKAVLEVKKAEYSVDGERMHNFIEAQKLLRPTKVITPAIAAWGIAVKQLVSVIDCIYATDVCITKAMLDEKFGDSINYLHLIDAMLREQHGCLPKEEIF